MKLFETDAPHLHAFAPGRTELAGNHIDHQGGCVVTATLCDGMDAVAAENGTDLIRVESDGYAPFSIDLSDLDSRANEQMKPSALVRGTAAGITAYGVGLRGFDVRVKSRIPVGGGLSSSAAFELLLCTVMNALFADDSIETLDRACIAQRAERDYFGKPCGLMDQIAIAYGGICRIDLADASKPLVQPIHFDFERSGYAVCLVDVGSDHSRYTEEYAKVAQDMFAVARLCGKPKLSQVDEALFMERLGFIRESLGDRATLRGMHFFIENDLSCARADALAANDIETFLEKTRASAVSSAQYLQNVFCETQCQPAMVALALSERALRGRGASRIHGGGFGGSIQAFVPLDAVEAYRRFMETHLNPGCCRVLRMEAKGAQAEWM